jgi:hypothetical protein
MHMKNTLAAVLILSALSAVASDRVISQTVDTATARVQPQTIGFFRGESVSYTVTPRYGTNAIAVSTNAQAYWTVTYSSNINYGVLNKTGTVTTAGVSVFAASITDTLMPAGAYDSFVRIVDISGTSTSLVTASRSTLTVFKSPYAGTTSFPALSFLEPLWVAASGSVARLTDLAGYYPASNPSGYVTSATSYTFANTNLGAGVVVTNGTTVYVGTNAAASGISATESTNIALAVTAGATQGMATVTMLGGYLPTNTALGVSAATATGIAEAVIAPYTNLIAKAWQNPASATNWTWTSDGVSITLTSYSGPNDVVVPDMLDNLPVTSFGIVFSYTTITSIRGGEYVATINGNAFDACTALTNAVFPSVTIVGPLAFSDCSSLAKVYFSQSAPVDYGNALAGAASATIYVTSTTATGWGTNWNGRPVVRMNLYADNFNAAGVGAVSTNDAKYLASLTNVTAQQVLAAGGLTNITAAQIVGAGGLTNVTPAAIMAAGAITNASQTPWAISQQPGFDLTPQVSGTNVTIYASNGPSCFLNYTTNMTYQIGGDFSTNSGCIFTVSILPNTFSSTFPTASWSNTVSITTGTTWQAIIFHRPYRAPLFIGR